jgi:hypothetical protein
VKTNGRPWRRLLFVVLDSFTVEIKAICSLRADYLLDRQDRSFSSEINRKLQQKIRIGKRNLWYHDTDQLSAELSDRSSLIGRAITICFVINPFIFKKKTKKKIKKIENEKKNQKKQKIKKPKKQI